MREIPLTQGKVALVDDEDYFRLMQYNYRFIVSEIDPKGRVQRFIEVSQSDEFKTVSMHFDVLNIQPSRSAYVHYINGNTLDLRKENLTVLSYSHRSQARKARKDRGKTSVYKGVRFKSNKWEASIGFEGKSIYIGRFSSEWDAAQAYNAKALELYGKYAQLNIEGQKAFEQIKIEKNNNRLQPRVNKKAIKTNSRFRGCYFRKGKWEVHVAWKYIGTFSNEIDAAKAYNDVAIKKYGENARLNPLPLDGE